MIDDNNLAALWVTPKNDGDIGLDKGRTQKFLSWSLLTTSKLGHAAGSNPVDGVFILLFRLESFSDTMGRYEIFPRHNYCHP